MFVGDELVAGGELKTWTIFAGAYDDSRSLTPLIFHKEGTKYRLVGIGPGHGKYSGTVFDERS